MNTDLTPHPADQELKVKAGTAKRLNRSGLERLLQATVEPLCRSQANRAIFHQQLWPRYSRTPIKRTFSQFIGQGTRAQDGAR